MQNQYVYIRYYNLVRISKTFNQTYVFKDKVSNPRLLLLQQGKPIKG